MYGLLIALIMEAASTSETSVNFYQTTQRNNPEDSHLQFHPHHYQLIIHKYLIVSRSMSMTGKHKKKDLFGVQSSKAMSM
jgi:hypothetical protein